MALEPNTEPTAPSSQIVIVDDDPVALTIAEACLRAAGMDVVACDSAEQAQDRIRESLPDVVVSDVMMPGITGLDLCTALRADARTEHVPVLLLTAAGDRGARVRALELGADDLLAKPFDHAELTAKVRSLARLSRMRTASGGERDLGAALGTVSEGVIAVDRRGRVIHANASAAELLGRSTIAPGTPLGELLPWLAPASGATGALEPSTSEHPLEVHGQETILRVTLTDIGGMDAAIRYVVTLRDMSDEHRASNLGDLVLSLITHKLRTPLTGIRGAAEMLLRTDGPPTPRPMIEVLHRSYLRLEETIERILDVAAAALEEGAVVISADTNLVTLVGQDPARPDRAGVLEAAFVHVDGEVEISRIALATSLRELVNNALAVCDADRIQVTLNGTGDMLSVTVADEGPGLAPGDLDKIFVPFFQTDRTGQDRGTGLGLTLVREVVDSAGGSVNVASPEIGGAVFQVRLPMWKPKEGLSPTTPDRAGLRIS